VYTAAVGSFHRQHGLPDPTRHNHQLRLVLRGATRAHCLNKTAVRHKRHPITRKLLALLLGRLKKSHSYKRHDKHMLSAAFTLAFYGFLRVSEFTSPSHKHFNPHIHPTTTDISWSKNHFHYRLKRSKTDQLHHGQTLYLPRSSGPTCPYSAMKTYLKHSRATRRPSPLFVFSDSTPLNRSSCLKHLRYLLKRVGYNPKHYNTHSFRIGAATSAAQAGLSPQDIKLLGRWRSTAYQRYIRSNTPQQLAVKHLALSQY
jgi:hypothetical protein